MVALYGIHSFQNLERFIVETGRESGREMQSGGMGFRVPNIVNRQRGKGSFVQHFVGCILYQIWDLPLRLEAGMLCFSFEFKFGLADLSISLR